MHISHDRFPESSRGYGSHTFSKCSFLGKRVVRPSSQKAASDDKDHCCCFFVLLLGVFLFFFSGGGGMGCCCKASYCDLLGALGGSLLFLTVFCVLAVV